VTGDACLLTRQSVHFSLPSGVWRHFLEGFFGQNDQFVASGLWNTDRMPPRWQVNISLSEAEFVALERLAHHRGLAVAVLARDLLVAQVRRAAKEARAAVNAERW